MQPNLAPLFEPFARLTQANMSTWTQFWMSPDQPWSPTRADLFGNRPPAMDTSKSTEALTRLWSGLVENQTRFVTELGQRSWAAFSTAPRAAVEATRDTANAATTGTPA